MRLILRRVPRLCAAWEQARRWGLHSVIYRPPGSVVIDHPINPIRSSLRASPGREDQAPELSFRVLHELFKARSLALMPEGLRVLTQEQLFWFLD